MKYGIVISGEKGIVETLNIVLADFANVRIVATAQQGIEEIRSFPADFAIMDSSLKDMGPEKALKKILETQKSLPVIVLVPSIHSTLASDLRNRGAYSVIEKPFDRGRVLDLVEKAIEKRRLLGEIEFLREKGIKDSEARGGAAPGRDSQYFYREVLRRFSKALAQVLDYKKLIDLAVEAIIETFGSSKAVIFLYGCMSNKFIPVAYRGYTKERIDSRFFDPNDELPVWLFTQGQMLRRDDLSGTHQFELYQQVSFLDAEMVIGLFAKGRLIGMLALGKRITGKDYSEEDYELLCILASYLAMAIENALLYMDIARHRAYNEKVLYQLSAGVVTIDANGKVTIFNNAAEDILEVKRGEVLGENVEKLGSALADVMLRTLTREEQFTRREVTSPTKKPLGVSTSIMTDEDNNTSGAIMVFADLSRVKELEEKEKHLERLQFWSTMAGRIAHEVKNPLVPIKTFAQLLPQRYGDEEFRGEFSKVVDAEIERLNTIVTQFTRFAEPPQPRLKSTDVHRVIEASLESMKGKLDSKKAKISKRFANGAVMTRVDFELLTEAISNILDNAADAIEPRGNITVATSIKKSRNDTNGAVEISVKDNGNGIPEDELKDIFTPFITSKTKGMGLGMPIARRIVMDHNGSITVSSSPSEGSTVKVTIPIEQK